MKPSSSIIAVLLSVLVAAFAPAEPAMAKNGKSIKDLDCAYGGTCDSKSIKDLDCAYGGTCDSKSVKDLDCSYGGTCGQSAKESKAVQAMKIAKRRRLAAQRRAHLAASKWRHRHAPSPNPASTH